MTDTEHLPDIEKSHGKDRLTRPRLSAIGTVPTDGDRDRDHQADGTFANGNRAAVGRGARRALRAPYQAAAERIRAATSGADVAVADALLADALSVYGAARAELGVRSVFAQGFTIAYAAETILAGYFMREAASAGFLTERGMLLHDRAMACETQAARAMTAALAAAKALGSKRPKDASRSILAAIDAAGGDE